jgi:hypothetical protein
MLSERWGTFSVIDHKNAAALVPEVLLYDRLVLPTPPNDEERRCWSEKNWDPELLFLRLKQLDDLAIRANWGLDRRKEFQTWMADLRNAQQDAQDMSQEAQEAQAYQMTRRILAQDQANIVPKGTAAVLVAAYQSENDFRDDFILEKADQNTEQAKLAFLLSHRFAVPVEADPEKALEKAIALSRKREFQEKRRQLYDWQVRVIQEKIPLEVAIQGMEKMVQSYNEAVEKASNNVYYKFAYTIAGVALTLAAAPPGAILAGVGALLAVVRFATFDRKPVVEAGESKPAAMFHAIREIAPWHD